MRAIHHLLQGIFIGLILFLTLNVIIGDPLKSFFSVIMISSPVLMFLGVMYPDTDEPKSSFFRIKQGNRLSIFFSGLQLIIIYPLGWFIYWPTYFVLKKFIPNKYKNSIQSTHRNFTHTLVGVFTSTIILSLLIFVFIYLIEKDQYNFIVFLASLLIISVVSIGFFLGTILHIIQDSYSKWGLYPFFPFNNIKICGNFSAFDNNTKETTMTVLLFIFMIFVQQIVSFIVAHSTSPRAAPIISLIFILSIIFIIFLAFIIKFSVRIENYKNRIIYLKKSAKLMIVILIFLNFINYIIFIKV